MDLGLGSFVEKFEEYFGRFASRVLVGMVGLAVIVTCGSLVWTGVVQPVTEWAVSGPLQSPLTAYVLAALQVTLFVSLLAGSVLGAIWLRRLLRLWNEATNFHDENQRIRKDYDARGLSLGKDIEEFKALRDGLESQLVDMQLTMAELKNIQSDFANSTDGSHLLQSHVKEENQS